MHARCALPAHLPAFAESVTALGARASVCRNERGWGDIAGERNLAKGKMEGNGLIAVGYRLKARIAPPLGKKPSEVQLGAGKRL